MATLVTSTYGVSFLTRGKLRAGVLCLPFADACSLLGCLASHFLRLTPHT